MSCHLSSFFPFPSSFLFHGFLFYHAFFYNSRDVFHIFSLYLHILLLRLKSIFMYRRCFYAFFIIPSPYSFYSLYPLPPHGKDKLLQRAFRQGARSISSSLQRQELQAFFLKSNLHTVIGFFP